MENFEGVPAHGTPVESGVRVALPNSKDDEDINVWFVDLARPGGKCVRYRSDARPGPGAGFWRTYGGGEPIQLSPYAIVGLEPGRGEVSVRAILPRNGEERLYLGDLDEVASGLHRAAKRDGFVVSDRQALFWAINDLCREIQRLQAARGCSL